MHLLKYNNNNNNNNQGGWSVRTMKILRVGTRKRAELNPESCCERVRLVGANWQYS
jgi:hypothetical protein